MEYRNLGRSGLRISEIGLGSWLTFGVTLERKASQACLRAALEAGINFLDTADVYGEGAAETLWGELLDGLRRSQYVLASKCYGPMGPLPTDRGLSRKHIVEACEASLRRLRTDYLDLYQCHRHDPQTPLEEVIEAMDHLRSAGKILYWGVSQWPAVRIVDALRRAERLGRALPASNQPIYNMLNRSLEVDVLDVCAAEGIGLVVYSPLAQGVLSGKYSGGTRPAGSRAADPFAGQFMTRRLTPERLAQVDRLTAVAAELGMSRVQLALAWILRVPVVTSAIIGATRPEQVAENAAAAGRRIPPEALERIEEILDNAPLDQYSGRRTGYGAPHSEW